MIWRAVLLLPALAFTGATTLMSQAYTPPLKAYVDVSALPQDLLTSAEPDDPGTPTIDESTVLDRVGVKEFLYAELQNAAGKDIGARITGKLVIRSGFRLGVPGLDVMELVVGEGEFSFELVAREEAATVPTEDFPFIFKVAAVPMRIRLRTDLLKPVQKNPDGSWADYPTNSSGQYIDGAGNPIHPELAATVSVIIRSTWDGEPEIEFTDPATGATVNFALSTPIMIGESGVVVEVSGAQIDLSATASPSGITDPAWKGVLFGRFAVHFTNGLELPALEAGPGAPAPRPELAAIQITTFSVGPGGFSGKISGSASGLVVLPLFGMDFELAGIDVEFRQNALTAAGVTGIVRHFPYFDTDVRLQLALDLEGNFKIGIAANDPNRNPSGIVEWTIQDVLRLEVQAISFEYRGQVFLTRLSGTIVPLFFSADVGAVEPQDARIAINGLTVTSTGEVSLEGGWITLPGKRYINFNAFKIELSQVGFGSETGGTTSQKWVGFSGGIELVSGLSAGAKVKKLQFLWPKRDGTQGVDIKLGGIEVAFSQPGVVTFKGAVDWFEEVDKKGFAGAIFVNLEFIQTSVSGRLVIGETIPNVVPTTPVGTCTTLPNTTRFKFFYIDLEANLPSGIPVFANVALYGFLGLFAYNMEPHICAFATPIQWFKTHLGSTNVVAGSPAPWIPARDAVAVGLGVIIGTASDNGYVINAKVALTVAVPGPLVILSGTGNIVTKRGEVRDPSDPLFGAIAIYDGRQKVFLLNLGVHWKKPPSGELIDLSAEAEAYFNLEDPSDWHLWLGRRTPESQRIRATVIKFINASAYYMLDPAALGFGAKGGYDSRPKWKFGPLKVKLAATFGYDVAISWRPSHAWGQAQLDGEASLKAFGFGVGVSIFAGLSLETPTPFLVEGSFRVKLKLPWPLPDPSARVRFKWEKPGPKQPLDQLVTNIGLEDTKTTAGVPVNPVRGVTVAAGHTFNPAGLCSPWQSLPTIPEIDEDQNGNGTLDPGEDLDGNGVRGTATPTPTCTGKPMVPVDFRPVVAFGRNTNETLNGADKPTLVGNVGNYYDQVSDATFRYNLTALRMWAAPKAGGTVTFNSVLPKVYGAWPALLGDPQQPGALFVKLWSKNPFSIYEPSTYLFYNSGTGTWTDWFAGLYGNYPCGGLTKGTSGSGGAGTIDDRQWHLAASNLKQRLDFSCKNPGLLYEEDLVLPPYHAFALAVESQAAATGSGVPATYRDVGYFHTEGVPLNLDPYVHNTVPESPARRHYRAYDVGLRFNETYMDLLYEDPGSGAELLYKDPAQKFIIEILDENDEPLRDPEGIMLPIDARWEHAPDHVADRTDDAWVELLEAHGVAINAGILPKDDAVYGRPGWVGGFRPDTRYRVRVWLDDPRLLGDARLSDPIWLKSAGVRAHSGERVLLYEFPLVTSAYESFAAMGNTYEKKWWPVAVTAASPATLDPIIAKAVDRASAPSTVTNTDAGAIGRFLAMAAGPPPAGALQPGLIEGWLPRVPAYSDRQWELTADERQAILDVWKDEGEAFGRLDEHFGTERVREPLPAQLELNVLEFGGTARGLLLEFPEPVEWARIQVVLEGPAAPGASPSTLAPAVVVDPAGTRAFVFSASGGTALALHDGSYRLTLPFQRDIGSRNPRLAAPDGLATETVVLEAELPDGHFTPEVP